MAQPEIADSDRGRYFNFSTIHKQGLIPQVQNWGTVGSAGITPMPKSETLERETRVL